MNEEIDFKASQLGLTNMMVEMAKSQAYASLPKSLTLINPNQEKGQNWRITAVSQEAPKKEWLLTPGQAVTIEVPVGVFLILEDA